MALSRAAAAAARKAAKSRGLQGNRAEDGSMLTAADKRYSRYPEGERSPWQSTEEAGVLLEKDRYPDIDEGNPKEVREELTKVKEDIEYLEEEIDGLKESNYAPEEDTWDAGLPRNEYALGTLNQHLNQLKRREAELEDILAGRNIGPVQEPEFPF